jgi:hypothetical protein
LPIIVTRMIVTIKKIGIHLFYKKAGSFIR